MIEIFPVHYLMHLKSRRMLSYVIYKLYLSNMKYGTKLL